MWVSTGRFFPALILCCAVPFRTVEWAVLVCFSLMGAGPTLAWLLWTGCCVQGQLDSRHTMLAFVRASVVISVDEANIVLEIRENGAGSRGVRVIEQSTRLGRQVKQRRRRFVLVIEFVPVCERSVMRGEPFLVCLLVCGYGKYLRQLVMMALAETYLHKLALNAAALVIRGHGFLRSVPFHDPVHRHPG